MAATSTRAITAALLLAIAAVGLVGCNTTGGSNSSGAAAESSAVPTQSPTPESFLVDLEGDWKQVGATDEGWFAGTISPDSIQVNLHTSESDLAALYWVGTFDVPENEETFTVTSAGDRSKLDKALFGSGDDTKDFVYDGTTLTFEFTIQGQTAPITLERVG